LIFCGINPTVPTYTSGFPLYLSSKYCHPWVVGIPEQFPPVFTPATTPSEMRRGDSIFVFSFESLYIGSLSSGSAKQYPYLFTIGFAPSPKPIVSRFTPTIPVIAPPNGSRAEGLLCVSALSVTTQLSSNIIPPELSLNTETQKSLSPLVLRISLVARWMRPLYRPSGKSLSRDAAKIVCLQCSDQV